MPQRRLDQSDIPDLDEDKVKAHLMAHYKAFGKKAPWKDDGTKSNKANSDDDDEDDEDDEDEDDDDDEEDEDEDDKKPKGKKKKLGGVKAMELKLVREEAAKAERARVTEIRAMFRTLATKRT